jgi:hypothetical protein
VSWLLPLSFSVFCVSPVGLTDRGGGGSQVLRRRESLVLNKSFNTLWYSPCTEVIILAFSTSTYLSSRSKTSLTVPLGVPLYHLPFPGSHCRCPCLFLCAHYILIGRTCLLEPEMKGAKPLKIVFAVYWPGYCNKH